MNLYGFASVIFAELSRVALKQWQAWHVEGASQSNELQPESEPSAASYQSLVSSLPSLEPLHISDNESVNDPGVVISAGTPGPEGRLAYEPEPLDGDFGNVEAEPTLLLEMSMRSYGPVEATAVMPQVPLQLGGLGATWWVASIRRRRIHAFRDCVGLQSASRVIGLTNQERINSRYYNFPLCSYCASRMPPATGPP